MFLAVVTITVVLTFCHFNRRNNFMDGCSGVLELSRYFPFKFLWMNNWRLQFEPVSAFQPHLSLHQCQSMVLFVPMFVFVEL